MINPTIIYKTDCKSHIAVRLGLEKLNKQGSLMKIIEYKNATNITVKFLDENE